MKKPKRTETELAEELKNKRAQEEMQNGLPKHIDFKDNSFAGAGDTSHTKYVTNYMD